MKKTWILTVGIDKFYLTEDQKIFYMKAVHAGQKYVQVDDKKVLNTNFQSLIHVDVPEETKKLEQGYWKCDSGRWHFKGNECKCGIKYKFKNGSYQIDQKQMAMKKR